MVLIRAARPFLLMNYYLDTATDLQLAQQTCRSSQFDHFVLSGFHPQEL